MIYAKKINDEGNNYSGAVEQVVDVKKGMGDNDCFPKSWSYPEGVLISPLDGKLVKGRSYDFEFYTKTATACALIENNWHYMTKIGQQNWKINLLIDESMGNELTLGIQ